MNPLFVYSALLTCSLVAARANLTADHVQPAAAHSGTLAMEEVTLPLPNYGVPCASVEVVSQEFANSYGKPDNVHYVPPAECPNFSHVTAELNLTSYGIQYDRLMHLILNGVEIWRPSTPEPDIANVSSSYTKDLSTFVTQFRQLGLLQFDLDNIVNSQDTGPFDASLTLNFYNAPEALTVNDENWFYDEPPTNVDAVIAYDAYAASNPVSGTIKQVSRNTTRAVLNVYASGNANEEFWYTNSYDQGGPTRLVEVYIDGKLAGIADPFPIVYTGGFDPDLWSPLLGLKVSDVPSYVVDVTPFLPSLWNESTELTVAIGNGYNATEAIQSNWIVNVALLAWEAPNLQGWGSNFKQSYTGSGTPNFDPQTQNSYTLYTHEVATSADLVFLDAQSNASYAGTSSWTQSAYMANRLNHTVSATVIDQVGKGSATSSWTNTKGSTTSFTRSHQYPLAFSDGVNISLNRTWNVDISSNGQKFSIVNQQEAQAYNGMGCNTTNDLWSGSYHHHVEAVDGRITTDEIS